VLIHHLGVAAKPNREADMTDTTMLVRLQGINDDLEAMVDMFTRMVKSACIRADQGGVSSALGGDLGDVLVESLVAKSSSALEKLAALDKMVSLGNGDMHTYTKVKATQQRLLSCVDRHSYLFSIVDGSPAAEMHALLARLEKHYYSSAAPLPAPDRKQQVLDDYALEELCEESLLAIFETPPSGSQAKRPR
jgi:hypothetical protein